MKKILTILTVAMLAGYSFSDSVSIYEENDFPFDTDGWLTQALSIQYVSTNGWGMDVQQDIYTPENKDSPDPQYGDRPYAGYLHLGVFKNFLSGQQDDYIRVDIGMIGPSSGAEEVQSGFHRMTGMAMPQGWGWQEKNEPVLNIAYYKSYSHRFCPWLEYKPFAGVNAGNVLVDAEIGNFVRAGWNLPRSFCPTMYSFSQENRRMKDYNFYFYVFAGVIGQAVAYNHFLDGSLFQDEYVTVRHKNFTANGSVGVCVGINAIEITVTHIEQTEQWLSQPERDDKDLSIKLTYKF